MSLETTGLVDNMYVDIMYVDNVWLSQLVHLVDDKHR